MFLRKDEEFMFSNLKRFASATGCWFLKWAFGEFELKRVESWVMEAMRSIYRCSPSEKKKSFALRFFFLSEEPLKQIIKIERGKRNEKGAR